MPFTYNNWKIIMLHCSDMARIWGKHQLSEAADFLFLVHWLLSHETRWWWWKTSMMRHVWACVQSECTKFARLGTNFLTYLQPWQLLAFVLLPHSWGRSKGWGCWDNKVLMKISGPKRERVINGLDETTKWAASWPALLNRQYLGEPIKKNQMGGVYSRVRAHVHPGFWCETWGEKIT
jgi:hypothetical protein